MRLYPRLAPQEAFDHPKWGHYDAGDHGGFDLPDELSDEMHSFHVRGKRIWETEDERAQRERTEDLGHRRDPAVLYDTVSGMADLTRQLAALQIGGATSVPVDPAVEMLALRKRLAELEAGESAQAPAADDARPAAGRKPPAAKAAA